MSKMWFFMRPYLHAKHFIGMKKSAVRECSEVNSYFALHKIIGSLPFISVNSCITQPFISEPCEASETLINQCELCFKTTIYLCMCVCLFWKCSTMFKSIFGLQLRQFSEYLRTLFIISVSFPVINCFWHIPYLSYSPDTPHNFRGYLEDIYQTSL